MWDGSQCRLCLTSDSADLYGKIQITFIILIISVDKVSDNL